MHDEPTSERLLSTLERLLELPAVDLKTTLSQAVQCLHEVLDAEKVDAFLYDPTKNALRAIGTSDTPLGQLQVAQGLDFLPVANGGSIVKVYTTGVPYITGHADQERDELVGIVHALGVRSHIAVPITVAGERRGVLSAQSLRLEYFTPGDLSFLRAVGQWVGALAHRVELAVASASRAHQSGRQAAAEEIITVLAHELRNQLAPLRYRLDMMLRRAQKESRSADGGEQPRTALFGVPLGHFGQCHGHLSLHSWPVRSARPFEVRLAVLERILFLPCHSAMSARMLFGNGLRPAHDLLQTVTK